MEENNNPQFGGQGNIPNNGQGNPRNNGPVNMQNNGPAGAQNFAQNGPQNFAQGAPYGAPNPAPNPAPNYAQGGYRNDPELAVIPPNPAGGALALGIIGLVMAFIGGPFLGVIGGGIALLLGILAICLGQSARNKTNRRKGKGGFVLGIITVCFGIIMSLTFLISGIALRAIANERGLPLLAEHSMSLTFGAVGLICSIGTEGELEALQQELEMADWNFRWMINQ